MAVSLAACGGDDLFVEDWFAKDDDNDGVPNGSDWAPQDPTEWVDADGNGVGDNVQAVTPITFTLTSGPDAGVAFLGTANGDTYNAYLAPDDTTTLNAYDVIDGAAGVDTLNVYLDGAVQELSDLATITNIEIINIFDGVLATELATSQETSDVLDVSVFEGATLIHQINGDNGDVAPLINLSAAQTAKFTNIDSDLYIGVAEGVTIANVAIDGGDVEVNAIAAPWEGFFSAPDLMLSVAGEALDTINISGAYDALEAGTEVSDEVSDDFTLLHDTTSAVYVAAITESDSLTINSTDAAVFLEYAGNDPSGQDEHTVSEIDASGVTNGFGIIDAILTSLVTGDAYTQARR